MQGGQQNEKNNAEQPLISTPIDKNYTSNDVSNLDSTSKALDQPPVGFFGTVMNLLNSLIGAEILSISRSMRFCGLVVSIFLMTFTAIMSYIATILTVRLQSLTKAESLHDLGSKLFGKPCTVILSILVLFFTYSCCVAYLIIGGNDIKSWLSLVHYDYWMEGWRRYIVMFLYSVLLPVVLTFPKRVSYLSVFSTFAIVSVFIFSVVLAYKGIIYFPKHGICETVVTARMDIHFFNAISVYSLMFALPAICLPLFKPVKPKLQYRYQIVGTSFFVCYLLVIVPGVVGYLMFGSQTSEIILDNFPDKDIIIQITRFGFFIVVTTSYPIISLTIQTQLSAIIYKVFDPATLNFKKRAIILLLANVPPVLIAMILPNIYPVISVGGSLGGCMTNFFFPAIFWIKKSPHRWYHWTNLFCSFLAFFGFISAVIATYQGIDLAIHPVEDI
ncbi:hypothetical protein M9Y10_028728 [Tritrichomonas musculus]|uniref:Amino acid transporter transmembrane domain-containing protein n=1 Tax=Tritrichomonas musculus TaxID=1915356 RepID=A0ABR2KL92_9EUKA